jgi:putative ATP-binding cassette transporter
MATTLIDRTRTRMFWRKGRTRSRLARMLRSFGASDSGRKARWLFALLIVLLVTVNGLNVLNSYVGRDFMTALEHRDLLGFAKKAALYLLVFACSTTADVFVRFTDQTLALTWREWLSRWAALRYLTPPVYHRLPDRLIAGGELANPDERISEDVRTFTSTTLSFGILILNGSFTILAFSGVLWSISPPLFVVTLLYAAAGSLLIILRGRPLVRLTGAQLDKEANFRAELITVRENAEALGIARREDRLFSRLERRIDELAANFHRIINVNRNLGFFTTGYNYLIQIIPALVVGPLFIRGSVEFGVVTQSAMAFAQLVGAFSLIVTQFQSISSYAAVITRLGVLDEGMEAALARPVTPEEVCPHHRRTSSCPVCAAQPHPASQVEVGDSGWESVVYYERVTLLSPSDGRVLLKELTGVVTPSSRLLITGANEEAKGALFRATAGTWIAGSGRLLRPPDDRMLFVAEKPYLPPGTLREVLTSVKQGGALPDERIRSVLRDLGLEPVLARAGGLDAERRWDTLLSFGEQQLVAIAHVILAAPRIVFLERPGSALGAERWMRVRALLGASMAVVAVAAPGEPAGFYQEVLELRSSGGWSWGASAAAGAA